MADLLFPERPPTPAPQPVQLEKVVRREPLAAIRELLCISIDEVVNDRRCKAVVADLYRITRQIENESWLRRALE